MQRKCSPKGVPRLQPQHQWLLSSHPKMMKKYILKTSIVRKVFWHNFSITFSKAFGTISPLLWTAVAADLYFIGRVTKLIMDHVQFQVTKCKQIFTCNTMYHTSTIISLPTEEYTTLLYMPIS